MNPGQKHSAATRKKISEKTKLAMKDLSPNATAFKSGHKPWNTGKKGLTGSNSGSFRPGHKPLNWQPPGTIVTKRVGNWTGDYIKLESGKWERYYPTGKSEKKVVEKPIKEPKIKSIKVAAPKKEKEIIEKIAAPTPIKKTQEQIKADEDYQKQRDFLASFGITGSVISIPIKRGVEE